MAVLKMISARCLVAFSLEQVDYKPNQVVALPAVTIAALKALGWVDDDKAAVAYALQNNGA
jgi:hypothetical protein